MKRSEFSQYIVVQRISCLFFFFFSSRRRHTRLQGDWSSDVCSSDLAVIASQAHVPDTAARSALWTLLRLGVGDGRGAGWGRGEILGGGGLFKKKKKKGDDHDSCSSRTKGRCRGAKRRRGEIGLRPQG